MKRYTLTLELYVFAESDDEARRKARKIARLQRINYDNDCMPTSLSAAPYGVIETPKNLLQDGKN